jgi:hypothetical protein
LLGVSCRTVSEAEKPDDIEVAVFVEVADEADVEFPEARKFEVPLARVMGFGNASADDFDQIGAVNRVAEERAKREERTSEVGSARGSLDVADQERGFVRLAQVEFEIPPDHAGCKEGGCGALRHEGNAIQLVTIMNQLATERELQRVSEERKFLEALEQAARLVALRQRRLGSV